MSSKEERVCASTCMVVRTGPWTSQRDWVFSQTSKRKLGGRGKEKGEQSKVPGGEHGGEFTVVDQLCSHLHPAFTFSPYANEILKNSIHGHGRHSLWFHRCISAAKAMFAHLYCHHYKLLGLVVLHHWLSVSGGQLDINRSMSSASIIFLLICWEAVAVNWVPVDCTSWNLAAVDWLFLVGSVTSL